MESLRLYLNGLPPTEQERFALRCGTTIGYLRKALSLRTIMNPRLCADIERESGGVVTRMDLRPDDWHRIWPELAAAHPERVPAEPTGPAAEPAKAA